MFKLVLESIEKTVSIIAPPLDTEVEFKYHCEMLRDYFTNEQNLEEIKVKLIEDTPLVKHLNEIMRLLLEDNELFQNELFQDKSLNQKEVCASIEELNPTLNNPTNHLDQQETSLNAEVTISTLLECLLSNKILEIIINAAKFDLPIGIRLHCFYFLSRILKEYKVNLLNHCSIINQINELISLCAINSSIPGPYETAQIEFLSIIVNKIKQNYNLIHCFTRNDFPLLNSLVSMLFSPDNEISDRSCQLLIDLVSIIEEDVVKIILNRTLFKHKIIERLIYYYKQIDSIDLEHIETVINLQNDQNSTDNLPYQIRKFLIFLKWFSFLDSLIMKCRSQNLINNIVKVFKINFLIQNLSTNLFLKDEINLKILSTILTFACLKHCKSVLLKQSIIEYLLDEQDLIEQINKSTKDQLVDQLSQIKLNDQLTDKERINESDKTDKKTIDELDKTDKIYKMNEKNELRTLNRRKLLINRCRIKVQDRIDYQFLFKLNLNDSIQKNIYNHYLLNLYTLQLLEEILSKTTKNLFEELFIKNLIKRTYLDISKYNINNDLNELEELNKINEISDLKLSIEQNKETPNSLINNPAIKSVTYFVALIPNELKSCDSDFGFEPYIEEAQKKFDECLQVCENWRWPREIVDNYFSESKDEEEFVESDFISMLFDNLENIIQIPYELNLEVKKN